MQPSGHVEISSRLLSAMLRERELVPRATLLAQQAAELISGGAAIVYVLNASKSPSSPSTWSGKATAGEILLDNPTVPADSGILGTLAQEQRPLLFSGNELTREDYAHLHARRTLVSLACIPILVNDVLVGALEVASFDGMIDSSDVQILVDLVEHAGPGLVSGKLYEDERNSLLKSVSRLTQLYDLEKVFSSTLEMAEVQLLITSKIREVLDVQAVNLWFVKDQNELLLMQQSGDDPTAAVGSSQRTGEGYIAEVSDSNEPLLIVGDKDGVKDERLAKRNASGADGGPFSVVVSPLVAHEKQVGIIEAINKTDGSPFDEDDLFLLNAISESAAIALNNAGLLQAERKVEILETLVTVSKEITSTLNMDGVLHTVVNGTKAVVPYDRAAVALEQRGKLQVKAVSGLDAIRLGDAEVGQLRDLLEWATVSNDEIHIKKLGEEVDAERQETKAKFTEYFEHTGMRAFYAIPLLDDAGRIGILSFESRDPDFLTDAHIEMIRVLASQVTVALRNAELYKEVPFIGLIEPLMRRKKRFMAMEQRRRALMLTITAAVALFLIFCPIPMRLAGDASVAPQNTAQVQPEIEGVVRSVSVQEGDAVKKGAVLAQLEDWEYRSALAAAEAKYDSALAAMNRSLASNEGTEAGVQRVEADFWASEVQRARERLARTELRSPIDGLVTTPHVEGMVGRHLAKGDTLIEVVDTSRAMVDVGIDQEEVAFLKPGERADVKLESFPSKTFKGTVAIVSPKSESTGDDRVFFARVSVPNPDGRIRSGMQGRAKVWAGWRPAGYVLLRRPLMWVWSKLWSWFGW